MCLTESLLIMVLIDGEHCSLWFLLQCAQGDGLEYDDLKREIQEWNRRYIDVRLDFSSPPTSDTHPLTCRRIDHSLHAGVNWFHKIFSLSIHSAISRVKHYTNLFCWVFGEVLLKLNIRVALLYMQTFVYVDKYNFCVYTF